MTTPIMMPATKYYKLVLMSRGIGIARPRIRPRLAPSYAVEGAEELKELSRI